MSIKAVIFDLDGTITEPFFDFDAIRKEMGLSSDAGPVWEAMEKMSIERRREVEAILNFYEEKAVTESTLNFGAKQTLDELRSRGIYIGILTRNRRENALAVGKKHGLEFDGVLGREEGPVKPDCFGILKLARQFQVKPEETLMVGDYLYDLLCARSAGAVSVLLKNHSRADGFVEHADFIIENIGQILQIIEDNNNV